MLSQKGVIYGIQRRFNTAASNYSLEKRSYKSGTRNSDSNCAKKIFR